MKNLYKIILALWLFLVISFWHIYADWVVNIPTGIKKITDVSVEYTPAEKAEKGESIIVTNINNIWFRILRTLKLIIQWLLVIYVVYIWVTMIISMWTDEDKLSKSKNQLWYSLIALVFINIPWRIYNAIYVWERNQVINENSDIAYTWSADTWLFVNSDVFDWVIGSIISFIEVFIFGIALFVLVMAGIKIMTSRWKEEKVTEAKNKITYSIFAMIFVGMIEAWKFVAISWDIGTTWLTLFGKLINLALFFAGPVVILFLTMAGYYYITSNGDDEKIKKAKNIIINTIIAVLLLVVMFTFLNDLVTL